MILVKNSNIFRAFFSVKEGEGGGFLDDKIVIIVLLKNLHNAKGYHYGQKLQTPFKPT